MHSLIAKGLETQITKSSVQGFINKAFSFIRLKVAQSVFKFIFPVRVKSTTIVWATLRSY